MANKFSQYANNLQAETYVQELQVLNPLFDVMSLNNKAIERNRV